MKKVKWLSAFALVCALVVTFAFLGCGDTSDKGGKVNGDTNPADIISQQTTEEQWKGAFADTNFTNFSVKIKMTESVGDESAVSIGVGKVDGDKQHSTTTYTAGGETETMENYTCIEDGKAYSYSYDEATQTWSRFELSYEPSDGVSTFLLFEDDFSKFTYDNEAKAYIATNLTKTIEGGSQTFKNVTIKIVDGKISYLEFTMDVDYGSEGKGTGKMEILLYDYGTTTVTLPTVTE